MKKRFFFAVALAAIVSGGAMLKANASANETEGLSDLQKANIEALSSDPPKEPHYIPCQGSAVANKDYNYTDCYTCASIIGYKGTSPYSVCDPDK